MTYYLVGIFLILVFFKKIVCTRKSYLSDVFVNFVSSHSNTVIAYFQRSRGKFDPAKLREADLGAFQVIVK